MVVSIIAILLGVFVVKWGIGLIAGGIGGIFGNYALKGGNEGDDD